MSLSPQSKLTIWIYQDDGASELSVNSMLNAMADKLLAQGVDVSDVRPITSQQIINGTLQGPGCLVMPGGADLPYCAKLDGSGNQRIKDFVTQGNLYIGICAGAYYAAESLDFIGEGYTVRGSRELALFAGQAIGSITSLTEGRLYDMGCASKAIVPLKFATGEQHNLYYHGGPYFIANQDIQANQDMMVNQDMAITHTSSQAAILQSDSLQTKHNQSTQPYHCIASYPDGSNAIISGHAGRGRYLLSGVHFELCPDTYRHLEVSQACAKLFNKQQLDKERQLLACISDTSYAQPVYQYLAELIKEVFNPH